MFVCYVSSMSVLNVSVNSTWFISAHIHYIYLTTSVICLTVFIL